MAKCDVKDCNEDAVGGFREIVDSRNLDYGFTALRSLEISWCAEHEASLRASTFGIMGDFMTYSDNE